MRDRFDQLAIRLARGDKAEPEEPSRRDVIKRAGVVGGLVLTSPLIQSISAPAYAVSCTYPQADCGGGVCVNLLTNKANCGSCGNLCQGANGVCAAGACQCTPTSQLTACAGRSCGSVSDGCSGTYNCGSCSAPKVCQPNGTCV